VLVKDANSNSANIALKKLAAQGKMMNPEQLRRVVLGQSKTKENILASNATDNKYLHHNKSIGMKWLKSLSPT
jgi:hypothetical protein